MDRQFPAFLKFPQNISMINIISECLQMALKLLKFQNPSYPQLILPQFTCTSLHRHAIFPDFIFLCCSHPCSSCLREKLVYHYHLNVVWLAGDLYHLGSNPSKAMCDRCFTLPDHLWMLLGPLNLSCAHKSGCKTATYTDQSGINIHLSCHVEYMYTSALQQAK